MGILAEPFLGQALVSGHTTSDPGRGNTVFVLCTNAEHGYGRSPYAWPLDQSTVQTPSRAVRDPSRTNLGAAGQFSFAIQGARRMSAAHEMEHTPSGLKLGWL